MNLILDGPPPIDKFPILLNDLRERFLPQGNTRPAGGEKSPPRVKEFERSLARLWLCADLAAREDAWMP